MQPRPPDDRSSLSSTSENVLYLDGAHSSGSNSSSKLKVTDPFAVDGGATIKSGGLPETAWQASAAELAKLFVGKQLGNFIIEEALGTGGMAAVFKAIDPLLGRRVALKILPPILAAEPEQVQRFEREARLAAQMDHENVARVHLYGQDQGLHFIAYEFVEGINLRLRMAQEGGRLKVDEAAKYLQQAALGLAHAAARGVIHRDIKPSNLVINKEGKLKLVDLGLAKNSLDVSTEALTQAGATLGTFDYLSPEQAIDPRLADVRSDIYSLGCTFYHALTGVPPVPEGTAARKLQSHHQEMPRDPSEINPEIPAALVTILSRMMAKKPDDRYQSAEDLASDLHAYLQGRSATPELPAYTGRPVTTLSLPWYWQLFALATLFAGIILWESLSSPGPSQSMPSLWAVYAEPKASSPIPSSPLNDLANTVAEAPVTLEIDTLDELNQALKRTSGGTLLLKQPVYEIRNSNALVIKQGSWTIRPVGTNAVTLRLLDTSDTSLIEVRAGTLQLHKLTLELTGMSSSGIQSYTGSQVSLDQCELIRQAAGSMLTRNITPSAFIRVSSSNDSTAPASLDLKGSIWHPSQGIGILFDAPGYIQLDECWVASQYQFIVLPGQSGNTAKRLINFRQSSIQMSGDACIKAVGKSPVHIDFDRCIFSRPAGTLSDDPTLVVMEDASAIDLQSTDCLYHRIGNYGALQRAINTREVVARDWRQLRQVIGRCKDEGTTLLTRSPWMENRPWQRYLDGRQPFALAPKMDYQQYGPSELLGNRFSYTESVASGRVASTKGKRVLVVDGVGEEPNCFSTLNSAIGSITDEEETTIQLQLQGIVTVKPTELGNSKIILQAADGYKPEIAFHRDTVAGPDGEMHLFRLHDGDLTFENLRFRLESLRDPAKALSLVAVTGVGKCKLKDCIVTLRGNLELMTNVFSINDPTGMSSPQGNKPASMGTARLECADTIIRGNGQVLHVQTGRPFAMHLQQTGVALDGTVCLLEGSRSDMSMPAESALLQLDRCTTYHTRGLLQLRTSLAMPQLIALRCIINQSVLAMGESQPLVRVELQQSEPDLKRKLIWQGKRNIYLGATNSLMNYQQLDRETSPAQYDATLWSEFWGSEDEQAQIMKTVPLTGFARQASLHEWEATDFSLRIENANTFGVRDMGLPVETMPRLPLP